MAGLGVAVRLHEFRGKDGYDEHHGATSGAKTVGRQGSDVLGLYPGQLARVHRIPAPFYRPRQWPVECPPCSERVEERYQRSFDLLTLQALDQSTAVQRATHTPYTHPSACTMYQEEFGRQSRFYPSDDLMMTLRSSPAPLNYWNRTEKDFVLTSPAMPYN